MSDLSYMDKLLDGLEVEWSTLGEVGKVRMCKRVLKHQTSDSGDIPFYKIGTFGKEPNAYINQDLFNEYKTKYSYPKRGEVLISASGTIGRTVIFDGREAYFQDSNIVWIENSENQVSNKYLFYFYQVVNWNVSEGGTIKRLYNDNLQKIKIPIPPLNIQAEIVRILDAFTELTAELTAELVARKQQYAYYREQLLTLDNVNAEIKNLNEICTMRAGQHISASKILADSSTDHIYPCFGGNGIRGFVDKNSHDGSYLFIGRQGALCGNVHRMSGKFYATEHAVVVTATEGIDIDWLFHMLTLMNLNQYASKSAQPGLAVGKLANLKVLTPPLDEQQRIAAILDKFDVLTTSLTEGLPREIKLRQQQYEYYRELLLSFPKSEVANHD